MEDDEWSDEESDVALDGEGDGEDDSKAGSESIHGLDDEGIGNDSPDEDNSDPTVNSDEQDVPLRVSTVPCVWRPWTCPRSSTRLRSVLQLKESSNGSERIITLRLPRMSRGTNSTRRANANVAGSGITLLGVSNLG